MNFVAVAASDDLDPDGFGDPVGFVIAPGSNRGFAGDMNLRRICRANRDIAAAVADDDVRIGGNRRGANVEIVVVAITGEVVVNYPRKVLLGVVNSDNDAEQREQAEHEKDFPRGRPRGWPALPLAGRAFVELHDAPDNEDQRRPAQDRAADLVAAIIVKKQQHADGDKHDSNENVAAAWTERSHQRPCPEEELGGAGGCEPGAGGT